MSGRSSASLWIVTVLTALLCAIFLWRVVATIGLHVPLDPNEGWNAYHAMRAMSGAPLYPGAHSFLVNNYPPLSFYVVGTFGRALGDNIIAGRILSLLGFFATSAGIFVAARAMGCNRLESIFSALLFAACLFITSDYVGMDDPQLLGHALGMAGFLFLLREPGDWRALIASAFFFTSAIFIKHNLVALPLAMAIWLVLYDRRGASRFVFLGAAFLLVGFVLFYLHYGISLLAVLNSARVYSFVNLIANLREWLYWGSVSLIGVAFLLWFRRHDKYVVLCALYASVAIAIGAIFLGGDGVDVNAMFDADIALALSAGLLVNHFPARGVVPALLALPIVLVLWRNWDSEWREPDFWLHPLATETGEAHRDIVFLKAQDGPALCEMLSLCYWAGKRAEVDVFNVGEQFLTGARSDSDLGRLVEQHYFRVLQFESLSPFALTPRIREAVEHNYRIDHTNDDGVFLLQR
ncbi:MAG TPA: glycosyltransferase family 39 protein [Rhizomicrobium sp.]